MKKLLSKAKGLTIVILFLLLSCKTIKEENTEMFKDFLRQEKINYKDIIYSSYYKDFFCKIGNKTHYKDSTSLKYNRIYTRGTISHAFFVYFSSLRKGLSFLYRA